MPRPKWFVVARNEYRVRTSWLGKLRPYFLFLAAALLVIYLLYLAPAIVNLMISDLLAAFLSQAAVPLTQIILFMFFFMLLTFPISMALQETEAGQLETFLSAPIRPGDILLGEFMGKFPFYAIFITAVTGFFTAVLHPLGLDLLQTAIVILVFIITMISALWIGAVVGAVVRTKLGRTAHGKDVGRALALLIVLPPIAVLYAIMGGGLLPALANPETSQVVSSILVVFPSSWGAHVFGGFVANPSNIAAVWFETSVWFGGLVSSLWQPCGSGEEWQTGPIAWNSCPSRRPGPDRMVSSTLPSDGWPETGPSPPFSFPSSRTTAEGLRTSPGWYMQLVFTPC